MIVAIPLLLPLYLEPTAAKQEEGVQSVQQERSEPDDPCSPIISRVLSPYALQADRTVEVKLHYDFACEDVKRKVQFFIAVENSNSFTGSGRGGRQQERNAREGLKLFVEQLEFDNGSEGGVIVYASKPSIHTPLRSGAGTGSAIANAMNNFSAPAGSSAAGADDAILLAMEEMAKSPVDENTDRFILLVDSGEALEEDGTPALAACQEAKDQGIRMAVLGLENSEDRLRKCASDALYQGTARFNGEDIPERMEKMGDGLARAHQVDKAQYITQLSEYFDYVEGSGSPREPDSIFAGELFWEFADAPPEGGADLSFRLRPAPGISNEIRAISERSSLDLTYADTSVLALALESADVCIFAPGRASFCDSFALTLTPPAPTDTPAPTASPTPTVLEPTPTLTSEATPTPSVTPTEEPGGAIYLPVAVASAPLIP